MKSISPKWTVAVRFQRAKRRAREINRIKLMDSQLVGIVRVVFKGWLCYGKVV
jgi:hypothetical protein